MAQAEADSDSDPEASFREDSWLLRADRILVIRLGALGDVVRTLPAVKGIRSRYSGAHLAWLVEPAAAEVVEAADCVDEMIVFPRQELVELLRAGAVLSFVQKLRDFIRRLRDRRFDVVLDFHGILKSGLLSYLSGAPIRVGYARNAAREFSELFTNRHVVVPDSRISRYQRNEALVKSLTPEALIPEEPFLKPSALAIARLDERLRACGRDREDGFVLIHPGSSPNAQYKRYAPAAWAEVAEHLSKQGVAVWIAAGAAEDEERLVDEILRTAEGPLVRAPETKSFDDLLALLVRCSVFVSCDSGPLHAASLAGVPVVQILGPTDPVQNEPWLHSPSRQAHVPFPCSPCRRGCAEAACMRVIPPPVVVDMILELRGLSDSADAESRCQPE
ncbi:MAG: glycosyltransferase family 9 protein [Myxococcota bacterium]